ncbi:MAG: multifunctional oxoglutarate decarboxylase/oxoglutarate dehydrogenase thiamine pyrophosphate-binding subunit/dihydrolipoyllysine-residue succinyltransferase subunit [Bacteroidota bacterium]|nr:multifunctional oxoglutarate decarboxylase/oxoglutarate dehydrogenase thiamine pyrophosphate-binding subunit/dihydrolipoyllysine-residue succinyltransferase subunit [Bacteroidota bacterium]
MKNNGVSQLQRSPLRPEADAHTVAEALERKRPVAHKLESILESFGPNTTYVWDILQEYLADPQSVNETWRKLFSEAVEGIEIPKISLPDRTGTSTSIRQTRTSAPPKADAPVAQKSKQTLSANVTAIKGVAAKIVENMEASLALPTATSLRTIPVKVLDENRRILNQYLAARSHGKISYTHIVAWAIVKALQKFPAINASFAMIEGQPYRDEKPQINIGLAIDVTRKDGSRSLLVPNIKDAATMTFEQFVREYETIVQKARSGTLDPADFQGTSITLTNPGTVGTVSSMPRLMPGQGTIIATGTINYPAEYQGMSSETIAMLGVSKVMNITCTYDHRVIQGAESGQFLAYIHTLLLGEEKFYDSLFSDLKIPFEPVRWQQDRNPYIAGGTNAELIEKQARVLQLINAYRVRGHLIAHLDPLVNEPHNHSELDPSYYGLTVWDLDRRFVSAAQEGFGNTTLREILDALQATYCGAIGVEYMNIQHPAQKLWLQKQMEPTRNRASLSPRRKKRILSVLTSAEGFEHFLHTKFIGHKRFSLEGAETLIPILDVLLDDMADHGTARAVIGMAHRGRLNVLANTIGKPLAKILSEFEESDPNSIQGSGDVKYHLGAHGEHTSLNGNKIEVEVAPNPSHLEAVNPVVEGMVRAMQERRGDEKREQFVPILIHGDAAFAGQGIVAETLNLSQLQGYRTGGTIHIIINNQIGFTTSPDDARSTPYCTDVARMVQAPIFHVNGDNPEAAVRVAKLALAYRREFNKDVVIDMFCYRRYGHNEGDEPSYTQPLLYKKIKQHPSVRQIYAERLLKDSEITQDELAHLDEQTKLRFERAFEATQKREMHFKAEVPLAVSEEELKNIYPLREAAVSMELLEEIAHRLGFVPKEFNIHPKLVKFLDHRRTFDPATTKIDWALAESLAFGSLLLEGMPVRLSGQDSSRGTFSQRHSVLFDAITGEEYVPLNHIREQSQGDFQQSEYSAFDSLLSEAAVLGFEFGYSVADPLSLVMWEAQFGDFANGAQVMIDQFIAGAEAKWQQPCDLVLLLPHGYEGQGPEHSSARLERFLQLCAEDNLQVCNVSTPAQYFHVLRRQMHDNKRKPLVIMTPKSLLRHPLAVSMAKEFSGEKFREVIDDKESEFGKIKKLILCSGKIYYDAIQFRQTKYVNDAAIVRLEQFYPYPQLQLRDIFQKYSSVRDIVWVQEEPQNMGAWNFLEARLHENILPPQLLRYAGRPASAATATGSLKRHTEEQEKLLSEAFLH